MSNKYSPKHAPTVDDLLNDPLLDVKRRFKNVLREDCITFIKDVAFHASILHCENQSLKLLIQGIGLSDVQSKINTSASEQQASAYKTAVALHAFVHGVHLYDTRYYHADIWITEAGTRMTTAEFLVEVINILKTGEPK